MDAIPERLEERVLYVCERYRTVVHKCCCGCGEEVVTPLTPADWSIRKNGNLVSLTPSIGNWSFACKSHYWISNNQVVWVGSLSQRQIARIRSRDKADKEAYITAINRKKETQAKPASVVARLWSAFMRWFKS